MDRSPFVPGVSHRQREEIIEATGADIVTDELGMVVMLRRTDDIEALLTDPSFGAIAMGVLAVSGVTDGVLFDMWSNLMFGKDGEDHQRIRGTVARQFTAKAVEQYRPTARAFARSLAEGLADQASVDLWEQFSLPLAARVACTVVGLPETDDDRAARWSIDLVNAFFVMTDDRCERAELAAEEFSRYLDVLLAARRSELTDDVLSVIVAAETDGQLTDAEARALAANLIFGGLEAKAKVITTSVFHLVEHDAWAGLADDPTHVATVVEEMLRFHPPAGVGRAVTQDGEHHGISLHAGQMVLLDLPAACHDPSRFDDPDEIHFDRKHGRQMAFGAGPHYCFGASLARVVIAEGLTALAERFPKLSIAGAETTVVWDEASFDGIVSLSLRTAS